MDTETIYWLIFLAVMVFVCFFIWAWKRLDKDYAKRTANMVEPFTERRKRIAEQANAMVERRGKVLH